MDNYSVSQTPEEAEDWLIAYEAKLAQIQVELRQQAALKRSAPEWGDLGQSTTQPHPDELTHKAQWHQERNYYGNV